MTNGQNPSQSGKAPAVISVDAMGGDKGPAAVVAGLVDSGRADPALSFILHGDQAQLEPHLARAPDLAGRVQLVHAERTVTMNDKPAQILRHGEGTSMWSAIESVKKGQARVAISCGNTGALMALSMIRLRKLPGVNRPAIACFWPSRNPSGFNVMMDVGADIKADAADLVQYATMGAAYASVALNLDLPRVGLLNVGTEEHKGRAELKEAHEILSQVTNGFAYAGFVEGSDIPGTACDVIITDGFTGNVALKTGEGTAKLISDFLKQEYSASLTAKIAAMLSMRILRRLQTRMDPRRVNGGVFLGLNGTVVKSHGSADATGVAAAIQLAARLARSGMNERLAERLAPVGANEQGGGT